MLDPGFLQVVGLVMGSKSLANQQNSKRKNQSIALKL